MMPRALLTLWIVNLCLHIFAECRRADRDAYRQSNVDL